MKAPIVRPPGDVLSTALLRGVETGGIQQPHCRRRVMKERAAFVNNAG
jgi:hypothetical protein